MATLIWTSFFYEKFKETVDSETNPFKIMRLSLINTNKKNHEGITFKK